MMERYEVPEGWQWKRLGEVCRINPKKTEIKDLPDDREVTFVPMASVDVGSGAIYQPHARKLGEVRKGYTYFVEGDVLFAKITPCMENGKFAVARDLLNGIGFGTTEFHVIRPKNGVLSEWVHFWIRQRAFREYAETRMTGSAGQQRVPVDVLEEALIPLPPLAEQRRMVARIEEVVRRVGEARGLQKEAIEKAESLLPAALSQVFSDSERWNIRSVSEICEKPQYGYTQSATTQAIGPKFLRITDIQNGQVDWQAVPYCRCDDIDKYRLRPSDILFARTGATTGKSYLVWDCPEAIFASYLIRLRAKSEVLPHFLWWYFQSPNYWRQVFGGIEVGAQPNMNGKKLVGLRVRVPPISEQHRIVAYLDSIRAKAEELKRQQQATQAELDKVIASVLSKAFRGELRWGLKSAISPTRKMVGVSCGPGLDETRRRSALCAVGVRRR